jgi:hypothetical protein
MSRSRSVAMMALIFFGMSIFLVGNAVAGREATESVTGSWYSTSKVIAVGEDFMYGAYEGFSVWVGDTGKEMLHGASLHNVGQWHVEKGSYGETGGVVWNLPNGDKIYLKYFASEASKGTITAVGGTGKCAGIEGSGEYTVHPATPSIEGLWQGLIKMKFHYKLP